MDLYQLKTFVTVAREGSITRASESLHLSQPAVSAHIKSIEDAVGLALFDRTSRGMTLTLEGQRLLAKAERTLAAHQDLVDEATRIKGRLTGTLRLGAGANSDHAAIGRLLTRLTERCPDVEVVIRHATSSEVLAGIRSGALDAGFYNEPGDPDADLTTNEVSRFGIHVVAAPGLVPKSDPLDWRTLAELAWIYPTTSACCGRTAEGLFTTHRIRPKRIVSVDRQEVARTLVAGGVGVGILHSDASAEAQKRGDVELVFDSRAEVRVLFAGLASRAEDPLLTAAMTVARSGDV